MDKPGHHPRSPGRSQYRFLRRIATGGMAELYLGEVSGVGGVTKRVALKRMLPAHARDKDFLTMFLEEARLASTLQHPNIVQTYDVIQSQEEYVIVMELLEGADLQQFRRRAHTQGIVLTLEHVLYVIRSVLAGLHYAHDRVLPDGRNHGIVHRDVSPQNIFLTYDGGVKLLDFGIAKTDQSLSGTESGVLKGKVLYMSPEQCGGAPLDRRTDLYALGVVLYQLLTGTVPHRGKNAYDTMRSIIDDPAPSPRLINPRIAPELEAIVLRSLQKRPADRYPTARDMLADLERFSQAKGLFISTVGFSSLVEKVIGPRQQLQPDEALLQNSGNVPQTIDLPASGSGEVAPPDPTNDRQVLFEDDHAHVRRVSGVTIVRLSGVLDEKFDHAPLVEHLRGEVVIDTGGVNRITSFGIRSLIALVSESRSRTKGLYHVRCSVAFINQVTMIRGLLGGGQILSFHAPYIDAGNGTYFTVLLQGREGLEAVEHLRVPRVPSPSDPSRPAEFDDEPDLYLNFSGDFLAEVPSHLTAALATLDEQGRKLDVELTVQDDRTILAIRRPIRSDARWRRIVQGLEGQIRLDLSESPSVSAPGIEGFVDALEGIATQLELVEIVGAPLAVCEAIASSGTLRPILQVVSLQIEARCNDCGTERRAILQVQRLRERNTIQINSGCGRCGGTLTVTSDLQDLDTLSIGQVPSPPALSHQPPPVIAAPIVAPPPQPSRARGGCMRQVAVLLLLLLAGSTALVPLVS
ncbi:MAG TPA: serine/threonine protein kinase [Deltaproteobacteria bacterium]|nr:serine/threonine protein kinase [Deltaproteobacteria bacterium]